MPYRPFLKTFSEVPKEGKTSENGAGGGKVEDLSGEFQGYTKLSSRQFCPEFLDTKAVNVELLWMCRQCQASETITILDIICRPVFYLRTRLDSVSVFWCNIHRWAQ
jgi:hypothetical protein